MPSAPPFFKPTDTACLIDRMIGDEYDTIKYVAEHLADLISLATLNAVYQGADIEGIADSSDALIETDNLAIATGRIPYLPAGTYRVAENVVLRAAWKFDPGVILSPSDGIEIRFIAGLDAMAALIFDETRGGHVTGPFGGSPNQAWWGRAFHQADHNTNMRATVAFVETFDYAPGFYALENQSGVPKFATAKYVRESVDVVAQQGFTYYFPITSTQEGLDAFERPAPVWSPDNNAYTLPWDHESTNPHFDLIGTMFARAKSCGLKTMMSTNYSGDAYLILDLFSQFAAAAKATPISDLIVSSVAPGAATSVSLLDTFLDAYEGWVITADAGGSAVVTDVDNVTHADINVTSALNAIHRYQSDETQLTLPGPVVLDLLATVTLSSVALGPTTVTLGVDFWDNSHIGGVLTPQAGVGSLVITSIVSPKIALATVTTAFNAPRVLPAGGWSMRAPDPMRFGKTTAQRLADAIHAMRRDIAQQMALYPWAADAFDLAPEFSDIVSWSELLAQPTIFEDDDGYDPDNPMPDVYPGIGSYLTPEGNPVPIWSFPAIISDRNTAHAASLAASGVSFLAPQTGDGPATNLETYGADYNMTQELIDQRRWYFGGLRVLIDAANVFGQLTGRTIRLGVDIDCWRMPGLAYANPAPAVWANVVKVLKQMAASVDFVVVYAFPAFFEPGNLSLRFSQSNNAIADFRTKQIAQLNAMQSYNATLDVSPSTGAFKQLSLLLEGTPNAANDAAAKAAGVVVGGFYRNGSVVMIRAA